MTITNGYATLDDFNLRHDLVTGADVNRDGMIEQMIEAASRWIDGYTGRQFFASTATRTFTARAYDRVNVTDLLTVTTLKTDHDGDRTYETTWDTDDYDLMPTNAPPYQWIELSPLASYTFPLLRKGVQIAGTWGYSATTPDAVNEACLMYAARLYARKDTVLGVAGSSALGTVTVKVPKDEDIKGLLEQYVRRGIR